MQKKNIQIILFLSTNQQIFIIHAGIHLVQGKVRLRKGLLSTNASKRQTKQYIVGQKETPKVGIYCLLFKVPSLIDVSTILKSTSAILA